VAPPSAAAAPFARAASPARAGAARAPATAAAATLTSARAVTTGAAPASSRAATTRGGAFSLTAGTAAAEAAAAGGGGDGIPFSALSLRTLGVMGGGGGGGGEPPTYSAAGDAADSPAWWAEISHPEDDEARLARLEYAMSVKAQEKIIGAWAGTSRLSGRASRAAALVEAQSALAITRAMHEVDAGSRGYGGGRVCSGTLEEYGARLRRQRARAARVVEAAETKRKLLHVQLESVLAALEVAAVARTEWAPPMCVTTCRAVAAEATDQPIRRNWEKARLARAKARLAAMESAELVARRRMGITEEDERVEAIEKERAAREKAAARVAKGLPASDPADLEAKMAAEAERWARCMEIRGPEEEYRGGGFQAVVGADGSLLDWAGTGVHFDLPRWKARYQIKPWVADLVFTRFLAGKTGATFRSPEDMYAIMDELGATEAMRAFKVVSEGLPPQGMEALKIAVAERREQLDAITRAERAEAARKKQEELSRLLALRKDVSIQALANLAEDKKVSEDKKKKEKERVVASSASLSRLRAGWPSRAILFAIGEIVGLCWMAETSITLIRRVRRNPRDTFTWKMAPISS
jgi:hypothetical protein